MARSAKLDILRAVSVLLVIGRHFPVLPFGMPAAIMVWQRGGWIGVDLFFVLSGFLVSGLLFREHLRTGTIRPGRFLLRRGLKIYPAFWVLIAATAIAATAAQRRVSMSGLIAQLTFTQNYARGLWNHTWSLAVEEHFYFLLAIVLGRLLVTHPRDPFARVPRLFVGIAVVELALRATTISMVGQPMLLSFQSHLRMDALFCGVTISYLYHYERDRLFQSAIRWRLPLVVAGVCLLAPPFVWAIEISPHLGSLGLTGIYLGAGALLIVALTLPEPTSAIWRGVAYVGSHSYSIYLWHMSVYVWIVPRLHLAWPSALMASVVLSILIGIGMAKAIEFPVLRLRDRYWPAETAPLGSAAPAVAAH